MLNTIIFILLLKNSSEKYMCIIPPPSRCFLCASETIKLGWGNEGEGKENRLF